MITCATVRDLYRAIGVSPQADAATLGACAARVGDDALREDVYVVLLLDDERRGAYDRIHARLHDIGAMRAALGLADSVQWPGHTRRDFTPPVAPARVRRRAATSRWVSRLRQRLVPRLLRWLVIGALSFAVLQIVRLFAGVAT